MLKSLRYALATFCFAASVGCLGLWWRSFNTRDLVLIDLIAETHCVLDSYGGEAFVECSEYTFDAPWQRQISHHAMSDDQSLFYSARSAVEFDEIINESNGIKNEGRFEFRSNSMKFPLWYAALIFTLAGVAAMRFGRRFTLRSAIIATTVVAGLLGMAAGM
jgi:hypothetical protein